jgi:hypothetical protein
MRSKIDTQSEEAEKAVLYAEILDQIAWGENNGFDVTS